jgi:2-polyprenyl-6-methoxyphenol hydroxylase-like FAD-dependent oxidoreductase
LAWYDASRTQWLRDRGYLVGEEVMGSVLPTDVDEDLGAELLAISRKRWRGAAREIIATAIERKVIFGTPLAEYLPERLVGGRLALVGDAAHVASPMVGAGFSSGLQDGTAFIAAVSRSGGVAGMAGGQALHRYNQVRLAPNRRRVLESLAETRDLLSSTVPS